MKQNTNVAYLSDQAQNCLNEIFEKNYSETNNYMESIVEIAKYLLSDNNIHDNVCKKYNGVSKGLLNQMILSNFLEITYYRRKNNIPLDKTRLNILESVEHQVPNDEGIMSLLYCDISQFTTMINDVLLYFWHPSLMYSYNVVKAMREDGFENKLYPIYALAMHEHVLTLSYEPTPKEYLLYTLIETIINATERLCFSNKEEPIPDLRYHQEIANKLKKYNGSNPQLPNLHQEILEEFNNKTQMHPGNNYDKILMLEILFRTINLKHAYVIPTTKEEKTIYDALTKNDKTLQSLSTLYDNHEQQIVSSLINNYNMFTDEMMLYDVEIFSDVKQKEIKSLKKRL